MNKKSIETLMQGTDHWIELDPILSSSDRKGRVSLLACGAQGARDEENEDGRKKKSSMRGIADDDHGSARPPPAEESQNSKEEARSNSNDQTTYLTAAENPYSVINSYLRNPLTTQVDVNAAAAYMKQRLETVSDYYKGSDS